MSRRRSRRSEEDGEFAEPAEHEPVAVSPVEFGRVDGEAHHVRPTKRSPRHAARTAATADARSAGSHTAC